MKIAWHWVSRLHFQIARPLRLGLHFSIETLAVRDNVSVKIYVMQRSAPREVNAMF